MHLLREEGASVDGLDTLLNHRSGLRGLSGVSGDLREVLAARDGGDERAALAVDVYVHRLRFHLGAMLGALGGLDAVVFTAGVGEHAAEVRAAALSRSRSWASRSTARATPARGADCDVAADGSPVAALVVRAHEEWAIARSAIELVSSAGRGTAGSSRAAIRRGPGALSRAG